LPTSFCRFGYFRKIGQILFCGPIAVWQGTVHIQENSGNCGGLNFGDGTTLKEIERTTILSALEDRGWVVGGSEGAARSHSFGQA
jgi:hypothetical protein